MLEKIQSRAISKKEQDFAITFLVLCYFRIPKFRAKICDLLRDDTRELPEYC